MERKLPIDEIMQPIDSPFARSRKLKELPYSIDRTLAWLKKFQLCKEWAIGTINAMAMAIVLVNPGCGYVSSGQWENDPGNWKRAFGESAPDSIKVVKSWYMRTAHFTSEYAWFFKIEIDTPTRDKIQTDSDFEKLSSLDSSSLKLQVYSEIPDWFPVSELGGYDVYRSKSQQSFLILLERDGNIAYWTAHQL